MNQNEFRNDLHWTLQRELDFDLQRYGQITTDTKLKIERCGYKVIDNNKVVYDEDSKFRR